MSYSRNSKTPTKCCDIMCNLTNKIFFSRIRIVCLITTPQRNFIERNMRCNIMCNLRNRISFSQILGMFRRITCAHTLIYSSAKSYNPACMQTVRQLHRCCGNLADRSSTLIQLWDCI